MIIINIDSKIFNIAQKHDIGLKFYKMSFINNNLNEENYSQIQTIYFHIIDKCNLSCAHCDNFSPLAKNNNEENINVFSKLIKQLKNICPNIPHLSIGGGEPFLHSNIIDICKILRIYYPTSKIIINTNGILLYQKVTNSILANLAKLNINISVSTYPILTELYRKRIKYRCDKYNLTCYFRTRDVFYNISLYSKDDGEDIDDLTISNTFYNCNWAGFDNNKRITYRCVQLNSNGDFYFCGISANIHILNEYFGTNYKPIKNKDYVNIFELKNNTELLEKYNNPISFCKYCIKRTNSECKYYWKFSKRDKSEWLLER